jgi:hypothetical protein
MARHRETRPKRDGEPENNCAGGHYAVTRAAYIFPVVTRKDATMTPEERSLITELFDRLATLENAPRDPAAEQAIYDDFQRAPNAAYALVQTVLVQDEALKRADARIRELEAAAAPEAAPRDSSFLGGMRQTLGLGETRRGSVPSVQPGMSSAWRNTGTPAMQGQGEPMPAFAPMAPSGPMASAPMAPGGPGGSFLGTAAAAAAGVVGGSLLMSGIRSMMGGGHAHGAFDPSASAPRGGGSPWGGGSDGGDLSRQVGLDDMGKTPLARGDDGGRAGLFDRAGGDAGSTTEATDDQDDDADFSDQDADFGDDNDDFGEDFGGDDGGEE